MNKALLTTIKDRIDDISIIVGDGNYDRLDRDELRWSLEDIHAIIQYVQAQLHKE